MKIDIISQGVVHPVCFQRLLAGYFDEHGEQSMNTATLTRSKSLIGTAVPADTFILLETPQPWDKPALLSPGVPESVRQAIKPWLEAGARVHLIANGQTLNQSQRRILIFQRPGKSNPGRDTPLVGKYKSWEILVDTPADMAPALDAFLQGEPVGQMSSLSGQRHLMVCTHASHNECCGIYGYPFYKDAIATIQTLGLSKKVQPWQISHIGGHRFAPTLIDFPQGRYYGNLDQEALRCLLKQQGDIEPLLSTYRGWSLLLKPLQILEVELLRRHQWDWLQGRVAGRLLKQDKGLARVELWFESAQQPLVRYTGEIHNNELHRYQREPGENATVAQLIHRKTG